jgi:DNA ligase-1
MPPIKPLLAATLDPLVDPDVFKRLKFPYLGSPKLDGIRATGWGGQLQSRSGKAIPSLQAQGMFGHLSGLDGELIIGRPTDLNVYNTTQSHVMSYNKPGDIHFHVFDRVDDRPFDARLLSLPQGDAYLHKVPHTFIKSLDELLETEQSYLEEGYEGMMLRDPRGRYKHGRSTFNEGILFKLKRFKEEEAKIMGFVEQYTNTNEAKRDVLGYIERSQSKCGMIPANTLGKFVVDFKGTLLEVGCGAFTHPQRKYIWDNQDKYMGHVIVFRHFAIGLEDYKPRFPRAVGFRDDGR